MIKEKPTIIGDNHIFSQVKRFRLGINVTPNLFLKLLMASGMMLLTGISDSYADVLELKNSAILNGKYIGGTSGTIRFETNAGLQVIPTSDAVALTFTSPEKEVSHEVSSQREPESAPQEIPVPQNITIPAGTLLLVRMEEPVSSKDKPGKRFSTQLENDLVGQGQVLAKAGTTIYGRVEQSQQAGRMAGKSKLELRLTEMNINGALVPIMTSNYADIGKGSFRKTARNAAVGAAIGGAIDGGKGAGVGAAVGASTALLRRGAAVSLPVNSMLEFRLIQSTTVTLK